MSLTRLGLVQVAPVDELVLERREERLGDGFVIAIPLEPIETALRASRAAWPKPSETDASPDRSGGPGRASGRRREMPVSSPSTTTSARISSAIDS
jgi:hypothetical protein